MNDLAPATRDKPWPVAVMGSKIRDYIERLGTVWVEGELTQWQNRQGNIYAKLKDLTEDVTVSITVWRSVSQTFTDSFKQGDRVVALVKANYWLKGGSLTMQVFDLKHVGLGDLLERLERLRRQLQSEGLFAVERKKPLPFLPNRIGLITGRDSDAEKDVIKNSLLRWPSVEFEVLYAAVQGDRAAAEVTQALRLLDSDPRVDVIIIARGGGDFQHLLPFSDEALIRAVAAAQTPVVSAIGHEADRPLLDEVADLRASTPTDAAKRVVPDVAEENERVSSLKLRMTSRVNHAVNAEFEKIQALRERPALLYPARIVEQREEELIRWVARSAELAHRALADAQKDTLELRGKLNTLSPRATLERGYAIARTLSGNIVRTPADAPAGEQLQVAVAGGQIAATSHGELH